MPILVYLSEVSAWWSIERQQAALASVLPIAKVFCDRLGVRDRRAQRPDSLVERVAMLRPTTRLRSEVIHVASLAVLAWSRDDMREVLAAIEARGAELVSSEGYSGDLLAAWAEARRLSRLQGAALMGSAISAERRRAASLAAMAPIRPLWPLSSKEHPTSELLARCGLSLNTVKAELGPRPIAQYKHKLKLAQQARRARKEAPDHE